MRLRLPELLRRRGMTPYRLAKASDDRISISQAYRLVEDNGRFGFISATMLEALCDVLGVEPSELLERETGVRKRLTRRRH